MSLDTINLSELNLMMPRDKANTSPAPQYNFIFQPIYPRHSLYASGTEIFDYNYGALYDKGHFLVPVPTATNTFISTFESVVNSGQFPTLNHKRRYIHEELFEYVHKNIKLLPFSKIIKDRVT